ncbi:MAG: hypothetical protein ACI9FD_004680 [Gammaproteobacteria bacterium]|jgi:hypothetical protein
MLAMTITMLPYKRLGNSARQMYLLCSENSASNRQKNTQGGANQHNCWDSLLKVLPVIYLQIVAYQKFNGWVKQGSLVADCHLLSAATISHFRFHRTAAMSI